MKSKKKTSKHFSTFKTYFLKYLPPVRFAMLLLTIVTIFVLFIPPLMGKSDNGTYQPVLISNGLYEIPGKKEYFSDFYPKFKLMQYYNPNQYQVMSIQNLFIQIAILLNKTVYSTKIFDIRFLAFIYWLMYLLAVYILLRGITKKMSQKHAYFSSLLTIFLLGDASYLAYFNSFYSTPVLFITLIFFVGLGVLAYQQKKIKYMFILIGLQFWVGLAFPLINKTSIYYLVGVIITLLGALVFIKDNRYKSGIISLIIAVIPMSLLLSSMILSPMDEKEKFNSMSTGVLRVAKNPGKAMQDLGMEPQYEMLRGVDYDQSYVLKKSKSEVIKENFLDYIHTWRKIIYYVLHPIDLFNMLDIGIENQNVINQKTKDKSFWATLESTFLQGATQIKGAFLPKRFIFYVLLVVIIIIIYIVIAIRGAQMGTYVYTARLMGQIGLIMMMFVAYIMPVITAGSANMVQRMEPASLIIDLLLIIVLSDFIRHDIWIDKQQVMLYQIEGNTGGNRDEKI